MMKGLRLFSRYCFCFVILIAGCRSNGLLCHFTPYHKWFVTQKSTAELPYSESVTQTPVKNPVETNYREQSDRVSLEQIFQKIDSENTEDLNKWNNTITRPTMSTHYVDSIFKQVQKNSTKTLSSFEFFENPASHRENEFLHTVLQKNGQTFKLNLSGAISLGLSNNPDFRSNKLQPSITETREAYLLANFDPQLQATVQGKSGNALYGDAAQYYPPRNPESSVTTNIDVQKYYASGSTLGVSGSFDNAHANQVGVKTNTVTDSVSVRFQQHLLNGGGFGVNLADVRQARLHTVVSQYEFRAYTQNFVAKIELAAWDYISAARTLEVTREMYALTEQKWKETIERINNGIQSAADRFAFVSQLSQQESQLVKANCDMETARVTLMQLIVPHAKEYWNSDIDLAFDLIPTCDYLMNCNGHIEQAKRNRPDLAQAHLQIRSGQLDVLKTANGLLPKLDFFMSVDWMGYANVVNPQSILNETAKKDDLSTTIGLSLEHQIGNRAARANDRSVRFALVQQKLALDNLTHLAESDVYKCYMAVVQSLKTIQHNAAEVAAAQSSFEVENERMKNGQSTAFIVTQAQNEWAQARYREITNMISFRKNLVYLYLADGSLLERRGISLGRTAEND